MQHQRQHFSFLDQTEQHELLSDWAHQACVFSTIYPNWKGFTRHDVSVEWWNMWYEHAYENTDISMNLLAMSAFPPRGPYLREEDVSNNHFIPRNATPIPQACDRVLNYKKEQVQKISRSLECSWEGLSQEMHPAAANSTTDEAVIDNISITDDLDGIEEDDYFSIASFDEGELRLDEPIDTAKVNPSEKHRALLNELLYCMDAMDLPAYEDDCVAFVKEKVNYARKTLLEKKYRKGEGGTINVMTEALPRTISRTYHSKN